VRGSGHARLDLRGLPTCNLRSRPFLSRLAATTIRRIDAARMRSMSSATRQLRSHACPAPRTDPGGGQDQPGDLVGWETAEALLERTSTVLAPTRSAMNRSRSGLISRTPVETRNHDGNLRHASGPAGSAKAARDRLLHRGHDPRLLQGNVLDEVAGNAAGSSHTKPSASTWKCAAPGGGANRALSSPKVSPSSGANAEANTRPTTLATPVAASEMTAPP
jgi:hypothetical protein